MKHKVAFIIFLSCINLFAGTPKTINQWLIKAADEQKNKKYDNAIESTKNAFILDTTSTDVYSKLAFLYYLGHLDCNNKIKQYQQQNPLVAGRSGLKDFQSAIKGNYQDLALVKILELIGKNDIYKTKMINSYRRLIKRDPTNLDNVLFLAMVHLTDGDNYDSAGELFEYADSLDSSGKSAYYAARLCYNNGKNNKILYWSGKACKKGFRDQNLFFLLGVGYKNSETMDSCEYYLNKAESIPEAKQLLKEILMSKY